MLSPPGDTPGCAGHDDGFSLIEVTIGGLVLIVGMLGVLTLLSTSLRTTAVNNERVGATNLARELVESARGLDYADMSGTLLRQRLQARGLGSGTPWTIERRNVTYTIGAASCAYDSPTDKLAAAPPAGVCTPQPIAASGDPNGDDFRRTTFTVTWDGSAADRSLTQTTLVVNPSGGLGPRIVGFTPVGQTITANDSTASVDVDDDARPDAALGRRRRRELGLHLGRGLGRHELHQRLADRQLGQRHRGPRRHLPDHRAAVRRP